jgi:lipoprotein-releasing system ATP-binding protein
MSEFEGEAENGRRGEPRATGRGFAASDGADPRTPVLQTTGLARSFTQGGQTIEVLRGVDLQVAPGEIVALLGPSGSGKSTLLQAVGLLEGGFEGSIRIAGMEVAKLDAAGRTLVRRDRLGFVYQFHHLLPDFDATENVILPQLVRGIPRAEAQARGASLLTALGLGHRLTHRPSQLSGGEQQRVAVARALANRPTLVLADEPTGNLDEHTAGIVLAEFLRLVRDEGSAALVATHNERLAARMDRVVRLHEGRIEELR